MIETTSKIDKLLAIAASSPDTPEGKNAAMRAGLLLAKRRRDIPDQEIVRGAVDPGVLLITAHESLKNAEWTDRLIVFRRSYSRLEIWLISSCMGAFFSLGFAALGGAVGLAAQVVGFASLLSVLWYAIYLRLAGRTVVLDQAEGRRNSNERLVLLLCARSSGGKR